MNRFFVPLVFVAMISGLALGLIVGVVARSPETHANVRPQGYNRTPVDHVGEEVLFEGVGLANPNVATTGNTLEDGRILFFGFGCASCHGLGGHGGSVGPELAYAGLEPAELSHLLREDPQDVPKGMPYFKVLTDEQIKALSAFLRSQFQ